MSRKTDGLVAEKVLNTRGEVGVLVRRDDQAAQRLRERRRIAAAEVLQHVGKAAAGAEADDRRRRERRDEAAAHALELGADPGDDVGGALRRRLTVGERLQGDHAEGGARLGVAVDEVEPDDRGDVGNDGSSARIASASAITRGARDRGAVRQLATTKKAPWSSSGRKPVGVTLSIPQIAPPATATMTRPMTAMRRSRATTAP